MINLVQIYRRPKHFDFNNGAKWEVLAQYKGYGLGVRNEYGRIRVCLIWWQVMVFLNKIERRPPEDRDKVVAAMLARVRK